MLPAFAEVKDHDGNALRVHKDCKKDAEQTLYPARSTEAPKGSLVNAGRFMKVPAKNPDLL